MSMISFVLMGLLSVVFALLYLYDRLKMDDSLRHRLNNWTLITAGMVFVAYATQRCIYFFLWAFPSTHSAQ